MDLSVSSSYKLLHPMHTVLVSCIDSGGDPNIITLAWAMPTSIQPPLVAISIAPRRYSCDLIEETAEFVVNIPTMELLKETLYCGRKSGRNHDKFKETGLTSMPAKKVKPPIIQECIAHLECKLHSQFKTGDHTIFVGRVIKAYVNKGVFADKYDPGKAKMIYHLGGDNFATLNPKVLTPKL